MLSEESTIELPAVPADQVGYSVAAWAEPLTIDTYEPADPDPYPQFLDSRVYQGSSGKVFPLPFHDRIASEKHPRAWEAVHLENEWLRVVVLPELGGRIHIAYDKGADYDIFYRNNVVKPALVGLTGPWISGGVEFNWPQHHRPATYLPTDWSIEREADGSATVWCSDHDPFARMKGMHGIRLRPDSSVIEARVRLFNRSEETQTFLWWANVAAAVGDDYQSFFPTDVRYVADHAKRAVVTFPEVSGTYYGVDYPERVDAEHPDADRLDWYRNIPVPTSYMVTSTDDSFFGGYDHGREAGFVHWADRRIAPGKKQWTWGNAPFGHAWDANLTDTDGPYVELMAGVFTDNQPDFSFLAPGETKTFSQFWYPITRIGPALQASRDAALRVDVEGGELTIGVASSRVFPKAVIEVLDETGERIATFEQDLAPGRPALVTVPLAATVDATRLEVVVVSGGRTVVRYSTRTSGDVAAPRSAVAPPAPSELATTEELHLVASYLQQYRHATRSPEPYWQEAVHRDPGDIRSNIALGTLRYDAALYEEAREYFQRAIDRETAWAPNPPDGEGHYRLGLALRRLGRGSQAEDAFGKATWNAAQSSAAHLALARQSAADDPESALVHVLQIIRRDAEHLQARDAAVVLFRRCGRDDEASDLLKETLRLDPLDQWGRDLAGLPMSEDATILLDIALEYRALGALEDAERLLRQAAAAAPTRAAGQVNVGPLAFYHLAALALEKSDSAAAFRWIDEARNADWANALPSRLDDVDALVHVSRLVPQEPLVCAMLGSWYFDRKRGADAEHAWAAGLAGLPESGLKALLHRNLGLAAFNLHADADAANVHFEAAVGAEPDDARLLYEWDQLSARRGTTAQDRLAVLDGRVDLVRSRDDLSVERALLLTEVGRLDEAKEVLSGRRFQPWEGGEGVVLGAWDAVALALSRRALEQDDATAASDAILAALTPPSSLGEARHPLATTADLHLALGDAQSRDGRAGDARASWELAASARGDFLDMSAATFTERSAASIVALARLGRLGEASEAVRAFSDYVDSEAVAAPEIDYFATSLPSLLLFTVDPLVERDQRVARLRSVLTSLHPIVSSFDGDEARPSAESGDFEKGTIHVDN